MSALVMAASVQHDPHSDSIHLSPDDRMSSSDVSERSSMADMPTETLIAGRSKRQSAGNRMSTLLGNEQDEDDLNLLFAEDEGDEDNEFNTSDSFDDSDDGSSSSSSSEDENAKADLEGEKQLQKEERAEQRARKRKAPAFIKNPVVRKRVKIDTAAKQHEVLDPVALARQRKKAPPRAPAQEGSRKSSRTLAVQNKEKTQESIKQNEARRKKQMAVMAAIQRKREAEKTQPMTQEERMIEAAETERLNSKSLNTYEETEKERLRKQRARLEALQNRVLEGPVIRWCTARGEWVGNHLKRLGRRPLVEEISDSATPEQPLKKKPGPKPKALAGAAPGHKKTTSSQSVSQVEQPIEKQIFIPELSTDKGNILSSQKEHRPAGAGQDPLPETLSQPTSGAAESQDKVIDQAIKQDPPSFLDGIEQYAALPETHQSDPNQSLDSGTSPNPPEQYTHDLQVDPHPATTQVPQSNPKAPKDRDSVRLEEPSRHAQLPPAPAPTEHAPLHTLTFLNFDPAIQTSQELKRHILFSWRHTSQSNPVRPIPSTCPITSRNARYRDPLTGLPYEGIEAFRAIRSVVKGYEADVARLTGDDSLDKGREGEDVDQPVMWSNLLGAWVGRRGDAARDVPPSFFKKPERAGGTVTRGAGVVAEVAPTGLADVARREGSGAV